MELNIQVSEGKTYAKVEGRLDTTNAEEFEKKMAPMLVGAEPNIELDCIDFDYISSSGLRLFLTLQKSVIARNGKLTIKNMKPEIREVFDMTGFSNIFNIE